MEDAQTISSKIDFEYSGHNIRFSFRDLVNKKYFNFCIKDKENYKRFKNKLKYLEDKYTWKEWSALDREHGLTVEDKRSESFNKIKKCDSRLESSLDTDTDHYFHFRVNNLVRIFGYQDKDMFCITHIDVKGKIHHC